MTFKENEIADLFRQILERIPHIDMQDDNLRETPERVARMYSEVFFGLDPSKTPRLTTFPADGSGLIGTGKIFFASICAHHFLPFVEITEYKFIDKRILVFWFNHLK